MRTLGMSLLIAPLLLALLMGMVLGLAFGGVLVIGRFVYVWLVENYCFTGGLK